MRTRKAAWKAEWNKCLISETKDKGYQDHHLNSSDKIVGRNSLMKRVSEGELHISQSDKGKRIVVMDVQTYYEMAVVHTAQDVEVGWKDLDQAQKDLRAHSRALAWIFKIGEAHSDRNKARRFDNVSSWAGDPPIMRCMAKTHKPM